AAYVDRLVRELAEHRDDVIGELLAAGATADDAARTADERLGQPAMLAAAAGDRLRDSSLLWRHRVLLLIVLPVVSLPLVWAAVLVLIAWSMGLFAASFHIGAISA